MSLEYPHSAGIAKARRAIVDVCEQMYARRYIISRDGNVSVRIGERRMLVTPSGSRKGFLKPDDLVVCDLRGEPIRGERLRPSSEIAMHVAVYESRPDVNAVVHAHPPCAVAHTVAGITLDGPLMPEAFCELGEVLTIRYTTPTTEQVPNAIREPIRNRCALLLERHGSITVGSTLDQAFDRLEALEHFARISMMSRALAGGGDVKPLDQAKLAELTAFLGCGLGC